jgi:hypothetical protein
MAELSQGIVAHRLATRRHPLGRLRLAHRAHPPGRGRPHPQDLATEVEYFPRVGRLHTDVLEERFGLITPRVLRHDDEIREAHLVDTGGVCRTFAVTLFPRGGHSESLAEVDREIRTGGSIGKTFRARGYSICKNILKVFIVGLPEWLRRAFCAVSGFAKARMAEFLARRGQGLIQVYGTVIEIYHPDFRPAEISPFDRLQESPTVDALLAHRVMSAEDGWDYLADGSRCDRWDERYLGAMRASRREIQSYKKKLSEVLDAQH